MLPKKKFANEPQKLIYFGLLANMSNSTYMFLFKMTAQNKKFAFTVPPAELVVAFI